MRDGLAKHINELHGDGLGKFGKNRGEDIAQDAALRVLEKRKWPRNVDTEDSARRYLRGVVRTTRCERPRKRDLVEVGEMPICCVSELPSPEDIAAVRELFDELEANYPEELAFLLEYTPHEGSEPIPDSIRRIAMKYRHQLSPVVRSLGFQDTRPNKAMPANDNGRGPRIRRRR